MPRKKSPGRTRMELLAGPCGPKFFDHVAAAAQARGVSFSAYVRQAVLDKMESDGRPYRMPEPESRKERA